MAVKELSHSIRRLDALRIADDTNPEKYRDGVVTVTKYKRMCINFEDCPRVGDGAHAGRYLHMCKHGARCDGLTDVGHCLCFWHVLPLCVCGHASVCEGKRHFCDGGLDCPYLGNPVHAQLFNHTEGGTSPEKEWLERQAERRRGGRRPTPSPTPTAHHTQPLPAPPPKIPHNHHRHVPYRSASPAASRYDPTQDLLTIPIHLRELRPMPLPPRDYCPPSYTQGPRVWKSVY
eukprot:TRINITY_DN47083_c0_g1_i1.p1 TRINITY_DN47083_c0_g1~~TRINITY_DN47083_c0_g1_i1.p1  ORF type:complete len:232 (+),score=8.35 TRINITY_DN47083_c0_g1_i1:231-926(+)